MTPMTVIIILLITIVGMLLAAISWLRAIYAETRMIRSTLVQMNRPTASQAPNRQPIGKPI